MTVIASGLGATFGMAQESTVGTAVTVTSWLPFLNESFKGNKRTVESEALYGGLLQLASHRAVVGFDAKGTASFELQDTSMQVLFENMLGAAPSSGVYNLGNPVGKSFTVQIGRPTTSGTQEPFTYNGCKIVDWEITCAQLQIAKLNVTIDGWAETTATSYAAPTYVAGSVLNFTEGKLVLGGEDPVGVVKNVSLKGAWGLDVDRFQIGATTKDEQLVNNWLTLTATAEIEFANLTDVYDAYAADTDQTLELSFTTATPTGVDLVMAASFINTGPPEVKGPAVVTQAVSAVALNPASGYGLVLTYTNPA
jgi:tail tube protein